MYLTWSSQGRSHQCPRVLCTSALRKRDRTPMRRDCPDFHQTRNPDQQCYRGINTREAGTRLLAANKTRKLDLKELVPATEDRDSCTVRTVIRAAQVHGVQQQNCTHLHWFTAHKPRKDPLNHTKFRSQVINRALRRHAGIGIQRCCRNKIMLLLAIDTQSLSQKDLGRNVCTNCALDTVTMHISN